MNNRWRMVERVYKRHRIYPYINRGMNFDTGWMIAEGVMCGVSRDKFMTLARPL